MRDLVSDVASMGRGQHLPEAGDAEAEPRLAEPCLICGAEPGDPCVDEHGQPRRTHRGRGLSAA